MTTEIFFKMIRNLFILSILTCVGFVHAVPAPSDPPEKSVPLAQQILDQAPPDDVFEYFVLGSQLDQIGFHQAAARIQAYGELLALEKAMGQPATRVATLRAVAADDSVERSLAKQARQLVLKNFTIAFSPAVLGRDTIASLPQMDRTALEHLVELAPGFWGVIEGKQDETPPETMRAHRFYLIADVRNTSKIKANLRFAYDLSGGVPMDCTIDGIAPHEDGHALCVAILIGAHMTKEGRRGVALASAQKASIFETLRALQQGNPAPSPNAAYVHLPELHLEVKVAKDVQIALDSDWQSAVGNEARKRLRAVTCEDLGTCAGNMLALVSGSGGWHAAITLIIMICLLIYQFRRNKDHTISFWPSISKLYGFVFLLAVAINIVDSPSGAMRGAPLEGTFAFLARMIVSLPWSYYFGIEVSGPSMESGPGNMPLADDSPWLWGFALINLIFLALMALGEKYSEKRSR